MTCAMMALCAVLCGADTWVDVAEWAEDNESWLRQYYRASLLGLVPLR